MIPCENESNKDRLERIIRNEILPKLESIVGAQLSEFVDLLLQSSKLRSFVKDQYLEESRSFEDGKLFYITSGIACTFYFDASSDKTIISRIWKKHDVIFDANSFQYEVERTETIQMLESGELLTIDYYSLKNLLNVFPKMAHCVMCLQAERDKYARFYQHLSLLSVEDRVRLYLNDNPTLSNRISKDCIATHLGISRSKFSDAYALYKRHKNRQPV
ncbi:DNA-binding transcriptional dual regulator Crp [compost metagenome]